MVSYLNTCSVELLGVYLLDAQKISPNLICRLVSRSLGMRLVTHYNSGETTLDRHILGQNAKYSSLYFSSSFSFYIIVVILSVKKIDNLPVLAICWSGTSVIRSPAMLKVLLFIKTFENVWDGSYRRPENTLKHTFQMWHFKCGSHLKTRPSLVMGYYYTPWLLGGLS